MNDNDNRKKTLLEGFAAMSVEDRERMARLWRTNNFKALAASVGPRAGFWPEKS